MARFCAQILAIGWAATRLTIVVAHEHEHGYAHLHDATLEMKTCGGSRAWTEQQAALRRGHATGNEASFSFNPECAAWTDFNPDPRCCAAMPPHRNPSTSHVRHNLLR